MAELVTGQPVAITDVARDSHAQYPELAAKAGIISILGVPLQQSRKGEIAENEETPACLCTLDVAGP